MKHIRQLPGSKGKALPPWYRRFGASWSEEWTGVIFPHRHNWTDFTFIALSVDASWHMSHAELYVALLGIHLRLTWYWASANRDALVDLVGQIERGEVQTIPFDDIVSAPAPEE